MDEKELLEAMRAMIAEQSKQMSDMMDAKLEPIIEEQRHTRVLMEHMDKRMDALAEGQANINEKFKMLDQVAEDVEEIKIKVNALESATKDNTSQIRELRAIK